MELSERTWRRLLAVLLATSALLLLIRLGATDLWAPDEPRYAQVAEELRSMGHGWSGALVLHLNGQPYTQKPPLFFWLAAAAGSPTGRVTEILARLPSALAGIGAVFATALLGRALFANPAVGLWAGALLLTVYRFAHLARRVQLDALLTLLTVASLLTFWRIQTRRGSERVNVAAFHAAMGLAVLTKGPVGLLPLAAAALYLAWQGRLSQIRRAAPAWSWALSLLPGLLWIVAAVGLTPSGFFEEAVLENLFGRFFSGTSHARSLDYYLYQLPIDFMPWTLLWPAAALTGWRALKARAESTADPNSWRFLLSWCATWLVFFSLSSGKRGLYLLPMYPALSILCGAAIATRLEEGRALAGWIRGVLLACLFALAGFGGMIAWSSGLSIPGYPGFALPQVLGTICVAVAITAATAALLLPRRISSALVHTALALGTVLVLELTVFAVVYPAFDGEKSPRPIALAAAELTRPGESIGVFRHRAMIGGVAYYAKHTMADLSSGSRVREFLEDEGQAIVVKANRLEQLRAMAPVEIHASFRSGDRRVHVVKRALDPAPPRL